MAEENPLAATIFEFGDFKLDCDRLELSRSGRQLRLERKPMELLILLISRQGSVVTRSEIAEVLWERGVFVDIEHGINTAIRKIRYVLRDDPARPRYVQTISGKGYRFLPAVAVVSAAPALRDNAASRRPGRRRTEAGQSGLCPFRRMGLWSCQTSISHSRRRVPSCQG